MNLIKYMKERAHWNLKDIDGETRKARVGRCAVSVAAGPGKAQLSWDQPVDSVRFSHFGDGILCSAFCPWSPGLTPFFKVPTTDLHTLRLPQRGNALEERLCPVHLDVTTPPGESPVRSLGGVV